MTTPLRKGRRELCLRAWADKVPLEVRQAIVNRTAPDGLTVQELLDHYGLPRSRGMEQAMAANLELSWWTKRQQMRSGVRARRWYNPDGQFEKPWLPSPEVESTKPKEG